MAAELLTILAIDLDDADIKVQRVEVPAIWFADTQALLDEPALALPIVRIDSPLPEIKTYRGTSLGRRSYEGTAAGKIARPVRNQGANRVRLLTRPE